MNNKILNSKLLNKVLWDFESFLIVNKLNWKIVNYNNIKDFYFKIEFEEIEKENFWFERKQKFIENKLLKELSEDILKNYDTLELNDIYNLLPQILCKIYNFLIWDKENINVDYYYILSWYLNFIPTSEKIDNYSNYISDNSLFEEIIIKTFDKINEDFKKFIFNFEFKLENIHTWNIKNLTIDDRIYIEMSENNDLHIRWKYDKWYIFEKLNNAFRDLMLITNILELNKIIIINDLNKSFWKEKNYITKELNDNCFIYSNWFSTEYFTKIAYVKKYFKNFSQINLWILDLEYFYLLSDKIKNTDLITASHFFWTDLFRFESQEFLSYWQSIEIMLWSPENNIKNELKNKFDLFFPNNNSIDKFWKIRNDIVHNWRLYVEDKELKDIEKISKKLFLKLIVSNYK